MMICGVGQLCRKSSMEEKKVSLIISGTGKPKQLEIGLVNGSGPSDMLKSAGLPAGTTLIRKSTGEQLRNGQNLYQMLNENELILANPKSDVASILAKLASIFSSQPKARVLGEYSPNASPDNASERHCHNLSGEYYQSTILVQPKITAVPPELIGQEAELDSMGFTKQGDKFYGHIVSREGTYAVRIEKEYAGYKLYIQNPPMYILQGPHSLCYHAAGQGWYWIHFNGNIAYAPGLVRTLQTQFPMPITRGIRA